MVASAVFIMDLKGKIIISRNYRGDIPMSVADKFAKHLYVVFWFVMIAISRLLTAVCTACSNEDDENALTPIITDHGYTFVYIRHNNLLCKFVVSV